MDWLEGFFPFLHELDNGNGALEVAFVILIVGVLAVVGLAATERARLGARDVRHWRDDCDRTRRAP